MSLFHLFSPLITPIHLQLCELLGDFKGRYLVVSEFSGLACLPRHSVRPCPCWSEQGVGTLARTLVARDVCRLLWFGEQLNGLVAGSLLIAGLKLDT